MQALRVLIVEDDAIIAELLGGMLCDQSHSVCGIEDTEAGAVRAAATHRPDLMIVDADLLIGTGIGAMRQILLLGPQAHLMMGGSRIQALSRHAVLLQKPFSETEMIAAIERVFHR